VRKDIGLREPYSSITPLHTGEVAGDLAYYLTASEQIPSAVIIALILDANGAVASSGGILIQTFPDTPDESIVRVEQSMSSLGKDLGASLREGTDITSVLGDILGGEQFTVIDSRPIRAGCRCSRDLIRSVLMNIHREELNDMLLRDRGAEVVCTFCTKKYRFDEKDLETLIMEKSGGTTVKPSGLERQDIH
jgi:molecular chaperone Hsp33